MARRRLSATPSTDEVGAADVFDDQEGDTTVAVSPDERVRELEAEILALRARRDLAELDELALTQLASQTAATIVRAAQTRQRGLVAEAESILGDVAEQASQILTAASADAQTVRDAADAHAIDVRREVYAYAERTRAEADAYAKAARATAEEEAAATTAASEAGADALRALIEADLVQLRMEAEKALDDARELASSIEAEARTRASAIEEAATKRRDAMLASVDKERRRLGDIAKDADLLRESTIASFAATRAIIDDAVAQLNAHVAANDPTDVTAVIEADATTSVSERPVASSSRRAAEARRAVREAGDTLEAEAS